MTMPWEALERPALEARLNGAETPAGPARGLDVSAARTPAEALILLNALPFWGGRLRWRAFRRRGTLIVGTAESGHDVRFETRRLLSFAHVRAVLYDALGVVIEAPRKGFINASWGVAAELIYRAAESDCVRAGNPEDDLRSDLARCWRLAGEPAPMSRADLQAVLGRLHSYRRDPHSDEAPPAAFVWERAGWAYLPALRIWLSTPAGAARHQTLVALREAAGLLGFRPRELEIEREGARVRLGCWSGPAEIITHGEDHHNAAR